MDIAAGKRLQSITGLQKPTGVVYLPASNQIGVANGDDGTFRLYNGGSYALVTTLDKTMAYTVKKLATMSGVSVRTLHF